MVQIYTHVYIHVELAMWLTTMFLVKDLSVLFSALLVVKFEGYDHNRQ